MNIGTLIGFIIGAQFSYAIVPRIFVILPAIYFICVLYLPETPQYLLMKGKELESKNSLAFYRNETDYKSNKPSKFDFVFEELKQHMKESMLKNKISWSDFSKSVI